MTVNGAELHYLEQGRGEPIVLVHGALEDYQSWSAQLVDSLAQHYRVIRYSRRHNFPNRNPAPVRGGDFSAITEAADLAALIRTLELGPTHVVGHSFGALTALVLATREPGLVRTLTISDPVITAWLPDLPGGGALRQGWDSTLWQPVRSAFQQHDPDAALRATLVYFAGADLLEDLPAEFRGVIARNLPEGEAVAFAKDPFLDPRREEMRGIRAPVLLLTGDATLPMLRPINDEVERVMPQAKRVRIPDAPHELWETHTALAGGALTTFLAHP